MDKELLKEINAAYYRLEMKQAEITHALFHRIFELESGWYNGHYHKGENGNWIRESYPIPVIGVKCFCDIEISCHRHRYLRTRCVGSRHWHKCAPYLY